MDELSSLGKLKEGIFTHHISVFISKLQVFHITQDLFINLRPRPRGWPVLSMAVGVSVVPLVVSVPMAQVRHVVHGPAIAMLRMVTVSGVSHSRCGWAVGIVIHWGLALGLPDRRPDRRV